MAEFDVAIVGEFNLDLILYGLPETLPPERELLASDMSMLLGGSPAITAHNLACMGNRVAMICPHASDSFASLCAGQLEEAGVDLSRWVPTPPSIQTGTTVLLQHTNFRRAFTYPGSTATLRFEDLDLDYLRCARHFHLASFFLQTGLTGDFPRLLALMQEAGLTTSLDTNDDPESVWGGSLPEALRYVDIFLPNEKEAAAITGKGTVAEAIEQLSTQVPTLIVKQGSRGAIGIQDGLRIEQPAVPVQPVDAVGAGDSFNAGFLHGFLQGWPLHRCLKMGNLAGAYSTTQSGGTLAFRNRDTMQDFYSRHANDLYPRT